MIYACMSEGSSSFSPQPKPLDFPLCFGLAEEKVIGLVKQLDREGMDMLAQPIFGECIRACH